MAKLIEIIQSTRLKAWGQELVKLAIIAIFMVLVSVLVQLFMRPHFIVNMLIAGILGGFIYAVLTGNRDVRRLFVFGGLVSFSLWYLIYVNNLMSFNGDRFYMAWPLWVWLGYFAGGLFGWRLEKTKFLQTVGGKFHINRLYLLYALIVYSVVSLLRYIGPEIVEFMFLPGDRFRWVDYNIRMYVVYAVYWLVLIFAIAQLVRKRKLTPKSTTLVIVWLWLSFPTYKHWDIHCYDYCVGREGDRSDIIAPILFSIEHLFWSPEVDSFYLLLSTLGFLLLFGVFLFTPYSRKLEFLPRQTAITYSAHFFLVAFFCLLPGLLLFLSKLID